MKTKDLTLIALFTAIMAICSWISIPTSIPFTLQTLGVFLAIGLLGGKRGTISILLFILLGVIGIPVFSNFTAGFGIILGPTGGYILGFLFSALAMWLITTKFGNGTLVLSISMIVGLIICYLFGTIWFIYVYNRTTGVISLISTLSMCVFPFIIPDLVKISIALLLTKRLKPIIDKI